ncbi:ANTAR domain-containing protein [Streptomyces sp. LP11]|uniref:ANTAR domain-containing protein n=1 Tax=Streptomyces pyxinicus TaxID=2970331 RepID=A0ABT2B4K2_9ACTN|nr:ANTAR domain-containing protein [Streptomyces sp. LP11]MCS0603015.1 ANTAR domain-containing protein [Streptomyces sp. LP11]
MSQETGTRAVCLGQPRASLPDERQLWRENIALRNRMLARSAVSAAQGILKERYRLSTLDEGFELLKRGSQTHNIKLHTLADAVDRVPGPAPGALRWFPGRVRGSAPPLTGLRLVRHNGSSATLQGEVFAAGLTRVLEVTGAERGTVQLAESGLLRLERQVGLDGDFADFFAFVDLTGTAWAAAARDGRQVTVHDVAVDDGLDEVSRRVILQAGSRACHGVPVPDERGALLAVISSHHATPLAGDFAPARHDALRDTAATVGRWLSWHRRTVVLDALEDLHTTARSGD